MILKSAKAPISLILSFLLYDSIWTPTYEVVFFWIFASPVKVLLQYLSPQFRPFFSPSLLITHYKVIMFFIVKVKHM